jgi:hypothetical protein
LARPVSCRTTSSRCGISMRPGRAMRTSGFCSRNHRTCCSCSCRTRRDSPWSRRPRRGSAQRTRRVRERLDAGCSRSFRTTRTTLPRTGRAPSGRPSSACSSRGVRTRWPSRSTTFAAPTARFKVNTGARRTSPWSRRVATCGSSSIAWRT